MSSILIKNAVVINEGLQFKTDVLIVNNRITSILNTPENTSADTVIDASGLFLLPGVIDDQVHFREPGLIHKGDIYSESKAAAAGGVTSYLEMPNTIPQATNHIELEKKYDIASVKSWVNYSFYLGATNDNIGEIIKTDIRQVCGIKVFMGSSTGNMLVDNIKALEEIFAECPTIITTHCEDENTIQANINLYKSEFGENIPLSLHPKIRSEEACYKSSALAVELATKHNSQLHILHISTARELGLLEANADISQKKITGEVCVHHLWFDSDDYEKYGSKIKWNPAIKTKRDKDSLLQGLLANKLDVVATDHAPHTIEEKNNSYFKCPSGGPLVQHSLVTMLEFSRQGKISIENVVKKMCHAPATLFRIKDRGYIREGYFADLILVDLNSSWNVTKDNILYKCGWSPFEGLTFSSKIVTTIVNGKIVYDKGDFKEPFGQRLEFNR